MKKWSNWLIAALLVMFTSAVHAEATKEDWANYSALKTAAHSTLDSIKAGTYVGETTTAVSQWLEVAKVGASPLERKAITAWAYNNAAYSLILTFKNKLNWTSENAEIEAMPITTKAERQARLDKVRELQKHVVGALDILSSADDLVEKAGAVGFKNDQFAGTLQSNKSFVAFVREFAVKKY